MPVVPRFSRSTLLLAVLVALISACSSSHVSESHDIDVREALARQETGGVLLDVRTLGEYQAGHAVGAHLVPWVDRTGQMNPDFFAQVGTVASPDQEVLVICQSGSRSAAAARALRERGYHAAVNVLGGSMAWHRNGLPWEAGP